MVQNERFELFSYTVNMELFFGKTLVAGNETSSRCLVLHPKVFGAPRCSLEQVCERYIFGEVKALVFRRAY